MFPDSFLIGRNNQGVDFRANVLKLQRYSISFEVYNPYAILRLSEVVPECKIYVNDRLMYTGRMVISSLVDTRIILVCEATLGEGWRDGDFFSPAGDKDKFRKEFSEFVIGWEKNTLVHPDFKLSVADMQTLMMDLRRWLEQVEMGLRFDSSADFLAKEQEIIHELQAPILSLCDPVFEKFEQVAESIDEENYSLYGAYLKRQLHPLLLCAPFVHRTFTKPLGFAGDYEMVNMILRNASEGNSLFAKIVNLRFLNQAPAQAHRNRIEYLTGKLKEETLRVVREGRQARVFNLGCGPAKEVQNFLQDDLCEQARFVLTDFNEETLQYAGTVLEDIKKRYHRTTPIEMLWKSVQKILKDAAKEKSGSPQERYDFIYCAGLFDYLSDRVCQRLMNVFYHLLAPGGLLVVTNITTANPIKNLMRYVLEWHLVYRDAQQLTCLKPHQAPMKYVHVHSDPTGVNLYLEVRCPSGEYQEKS